MSQKAVGYEQGQIDRFHKSYTKDHTTNCWNWNLSLSPDGYGYCYFMGKNTRAHRLSYMLYNKEINPLNVICHTCDNPKCVNPEHLYSGTQKDNMKDKKDRNRSKGINLGSKNGNSKLTEKDVKEILDLVKSKLFSQKFIATLYNIRQDHVSRIQSGQRWTINN